MPARKPVTSLILSAPQMEWLRAEAARLGISQSDVVRRIVDAERERDAATVGSWYISKPRLKTPRRP